MDFSKMFKTSFSHESQELLQSLPKQYVWGSNFCKFKGFWHLTSTFNQTLLSERNFQARDTDIVVVTVPKSGTTWLKSLVFAITKRVQYPISDPNHPLLAANPHELVPFLETIYGESENPDLSHLPSPRLFSTHSSYNVLPSSVRATQSKIIYLCRDPKDTFVSLWHFMNKIVQQKTTEEERQKTMPLEESFELFCNGISVRGPIWDHVLGFWNASLKEPEKVLFLKYEDLKGDIASQVKNIAEFLGFPFSAEELSEGVVDKIVQLCSFESLSNLQVNKSDGKRVLHFVDNTAFFRKGETGDWANYMTPSMAEKLDQITEQKLKGSGLNFH